MTDEADNDGLPPFKLRIPPWVAFLFFAPIVIAIIMYYAGVRSLNGVLIPEPLTLPAGIITLPDGATVNFGGRWSLLYVGRGNCDEACQQALSRTRQVHKALGEEMSRVQRFFISTSGTPDAALLTKEDPDLVILNDGLASWKAVLSTLGEFAEGDIFVADPLGNVVLRFPAGTAVQDMQQDLTRMLAASQTG